MFREAPKASSLFQKARLPLLIAGALSAFNVAYAQSSTDQSQPQTVERVTVTGSNIRRTDIETPSPVQVITSEDLKASGYTTVAQVLQNISANGQGTLSQGFPQAFAGGASGISLFGLTTAYTLVLIDGHRMAPYPLSDDGQRSFVDVSNIPFDAVERIEVLKDGASAVYGSDAIAGVVNIILKHNFQGSQVTAEIGTTQEGGGSTQHESIMQGWGDYDNDGYNAYVNLEYRHQDAIYYDQRSGKDWSNLDFTSQGGNNKTPGAVTPLVTQPATLTPYLTNPAAPTFSAASSYFYPGCSFALLQADKCTWQNPNDEIEPRTQNVNVLASFTKRLPQDWKLDLKASLFDSAAEQYAPTAGGLQTYPLNFSPLVAVSSGVNPHLVGPTIPAILLPAAYSPLGVDSQINGVIPGAPEIVTRYNSKSYRFVADLSGSLAGWDIDASYGYTSIDTEQVVQGAINIPLLYELLQNGTFKVNGGNSPQVLSEVFPLTAASDDSYLQFAEAHASRALLSLPGGDLGFAMGATYIDRTIHSPAPSLIADGIVPGNNAYVSGSQENTAFYAELDAPVVKWAEVDAAVRYDHFNDSGDSTTGKVGFKITPIPQFAIRGTVATGFRAPNAAENGQSGQAYLAATTNDPKLCPNPGTPDAVGNVPAFCSFQPVTLNSANPTLRPEESTSATLGFIAEPIKNWSTTVDLYDIKIRDEIVAGAPDITQAVRGAPVSELCGNGVGTSTCTPAYGPIIYVPAFYINANSSQTTGIQFDTRYTLDMGRIGLLKADLNINHTMGYILTIDGVDYHLAGTHGPFVIGGDTGNPRNKAQFSLTYETGPLSVTGTTNYIGSYNLTDPSYGITDCAIGGIVNGWFPNGNVPSSYCTVHSFTTFDLTARYKVSKQITVFGAIDNLFNEQPPVDVNTYGGGQLPYNPSFHLAGAIGRFFNVGLTYRY